MTARGQDTMVAAYEAADLFCLPSTERAESFGIVLLEAMRAGLPVVASDISGSGVTFVVRDKETGLLAEAGNAEALATAIEHLRDDALLRARFGEAGRKRYTEEFTLPAYVARTRALYQEVLDARSHRAAATLAA